MNWDVRWNHGQAGEPPIQIHHYDENLVVLRQSKTTSFEAPFLFLLFGSDRALLLDTGATADAAVFPLRTTVDRLIDEWLAQHPRDAYELVIAHTHGHGDHCSGDSQFADRPHTTVVARELEAVQAFFRFDERWPDQIVTFDLGGRILELIGSPGHHRAAVTFYDPWTGILFTGDTVLPARLYVEDSSAYNETLKRLVAFAETRTVTSVVGSHIEMTDRPRRDYAFGATYQPREHALALTPGHLTEILGAISTKGRGVFRYNDFILYNQPSTLPMLRLVARGWVRRHLLRKTASRA